WERGSCPGGGARGQQVHWRIDGLTERTLPSPRATSMPPTCGVWATRGSHCGLVPRGDTWNGYGRGVAAAVSLPRRTHTAALLHVVGSAAAGAACPVEVIPVGDEGVSVAKVGICGP